VKKGVIIFLIFSSFIINSCFKREKNPIYVDYPKLHFLDISKDSVFKILKLEHYSNFKELTSTINRIACTDSIPKIEFVSNDTIKRIRLINFCYEGLSCILIRQRNVIEVHNDSIYKIGKVYPIDSLYYLMNMDYNNNRRTYGFADSPKKLIISISYPNNDMKSLKRTLNQITKNYVKIKMNRYLNVEFRERIELDSIQIPPPPPNLSENEIIDF